MTSESGYYTNFNFYQNANADAASVKTGFLVRHYEYGVIIDDLLRHSGKGSVQHYLLLGRRGSGKSTLLRRLQVEVDTNQKLVSTYIAINLAEEQANIYRLFDLLEEILRELESRGVEVEWPDENDAQTYSQMLFSIIHQVLEKAGKKLILLLDNIDRIFEALGEDVSLLRAHLQNYSDIKIVGGSTRMTEYFWAYDQPFYEFFRVLELKPLDREEVKTLLLSWAEKLGLQQLKDFVKKRPGQLETIRILTDGLPRTLQFFVNILLTNGQETGYDYLRLVMDKVTPLYQERLNHLPPSQRKIVLQMAFAWEAVGAKELALATRMENRVISAQLSQLIEKGVAEKIETKTKNHLYRLSERFFNLWLIFTQGSPREKRKARYLSIFLENFYDKRALKKMAEMHLYKLYKNKVAPDKAVLLTKAFAQTRYISAALRDLLIDETLTLPNVDISLKNELPITIREIINAVCEMEEVGEWDKAIRLTQSIEQDNGTREWLLSGIYLGKGDRKNAEYSLLQSVRKKFPLAFIALGDLYMQDVEFERAEKYFRLAFNKKIEGAAHRLCFIYYVNNENKDEVAAIVKSDKWDWSDSQAAGVLPIFKVWIGQFETLEQDLFQLAREKNIDLDRTIFHLLVHHQVNLIYHLFCSEEFDPQLSDQLLPLFYASRMLLPNADVFSIRMPPEIIETIREILLSIYLGRDVYYPTSETETFHRQSVLAALQGGA